jgi:hypothetical protein
VTLVEGDAAGLDDDAYELGDGSTGPAADAGPFGEGHALTVADSYEHLRSHTALAQTAGL